LMIAMLQSTPVEVEESSDRWTLQRLPHGMLLVLCAKVSNTGWPDSGKRVETRTRCAGPSSILAA
jgi:hypothetical protein